MTVRAVWCPVNQQEEAGEGYQDNWVEFSEQTTLSNWDGLVTGRML
ncbi:MAG: hypothetical protein PHH90_08050 [Limnochordia bacterium]|nr:hypothetical protein [Limnochordia bacterium]